MNFLALMGISQAEGEEKLTLTDFVDSFRLEDVSLGGPVFDLAKLRWLNARYLRDLDDEALCDRVLQWGYGRERLLDIVPLARPRLETLGDWGALTAHLFSDRVTVNPADLEVPGVELDEVVAALQFAVWRLEGLEVFDADAIQGALRELAERMEIKLRLFTRPFYVALSGQRASTPLFDTIAILGLDLTRARIREAIEAAGGISGKKMKKLQKRWDALNRSANSEET